MRQPLTLLLGLLLAAVGNSSAVAHQAGDVVVLIEPADLESSGGSKSALTPGTCLTVKAVEGDRLFVSIGKVGRIAAAAVIPLADGPAHFTSLIEKNPADAVAFKARGKISFHKNDLEPTIADMNESLRLAPSSEAHVIRGWAWKRQGKKDEAMAELDEAIRLDPGNALAWRVRGATWAGKADYAKALAHYTESIRLDPGNPDSLAHRALLLAACKDDQIRDGKQALKDATRSCELSDWQDPGHLSQLAAACAEVGDFDGAVKWQTKIMELTPQERRSALEERLKIYQQKQPYRTTWR